MHFFSYISHTLTLKNKLEKATSEFLQTKNRLVIDETEIKKFKAGILNGIADLNAEHFRCHPIKASWYKMSGDDHLSGVTFLLFNLRKANN